MTQAIELAPPDPPMVAKTVTEAQSALADAQAKHEQMRLNSEKENSDLARAQAAFNASATVANDEVATDCELKAARAKRFADAAVRALADAKQALADAEQADAAAKLPRLREARQQQVALPLASHLIPRLRELYTETSQILAQIFSVVATDSRICAEVAEAARAAGVPGSSTPITAELVRDAFRISLAGNRSRPDHQAKSTELAGALRVLEQISREAQTPADRASTIRHAHDELVHATSSEVGDWFLPWYRPPQALAHLPVANRYQASFNFLSAISKGTPR